MPPSLLSVRALVSAYLDRHPGERQALAGLLTALDAESDPTDRSTLPGHITCGAVVIDRDLRVLHIGHRASGPLLTPGGHVEGADGTLSATALREVEEETGIPPGALTVTSAFRDGPIDIDVHRIDAGLDGGEPAHHHYDFRFVFHLAAGAVPELVLRTEEVTGAVWLPFDEVTSPTLRAKLMASGLDGTISPLDASAIIHDGHGRYLLHLRDANKPWIREPGAWSLLGGGREPQDGTLGDTIRRELREEAGLTVEDLRPYATEDVTGTDGTRVPIQVFTGRWRGDPSALPLTEGVLLAWISPEKFPFLTMPPSTRELLERHAAEHPPGGSAGTTGGGTSVGVPAGTVPHVVGVHLYLERDGQVLLGLRHPDSAYGGGSWHALAGHCEAESATACLVREANEEAGLVIDPGDLELVHTVHLVDRPGDPPRIQLFFRARHWEGTPELREPDACVAWRWWSAQDLPSPIVPYTRAAIEGIRTGRPYTETGWPR
ncbi:NUDIX domain-containing protein [Streptomyces zaomyceticus]